MPICTACNCRMTAMIWRSLAFSASRRLFRNWWLATMVRQGRLQPGAQWRRRGGSTLDREVVHERLFSWVYASRLSFSNFDRSFIIIARK